MDLEVVFADTTENDVNLHVQSITLDGNAVTTGGPYGLSFLGGSLYYTGEFIVSQTARDLAGGGLFQAQVLACVVQTGVDTWAVGSWRRGTSPHPRAHAVCSCNPDCLT